MPTQLGERVQRKDLREGLGLAAVQVGRVIIDAEQRRRLESIHAKRRAGGGVIPDLQWIVDIERAHILEIFERAALQVNELNSFASAPGRRHREPGDAGIREPYFGRWRRGCRGGRSRSSSTWPPVAGCAIGRKDCLTSPQRRVFALWLVQRPHGGEDPQRLRIEGVTAAVRDAVVVNGRIRGVAFPIGEALAGVKVSLAKPQPPWVARELALKSVLLPRTALQLRTR